MADRGAEARIQDLKRRLEIDPGSRLFLALAEEYRKSGRPAEALSTLQKGLLSHPRYVSAQVALGRAYLESGQITEAIATFSKVLVADPGNLVSAKSLADIYLSRGESVEAVKKYKLYRALSGDRMVDEIIARLEKELAPPPPPAVSTREAPLPPPPTFVEEPKGPIRLSRQVASAGTPREEDPFDITSVAFEPPEDSFPPAEQEPFPILSRDVPLGPLEAKAKEAAPAERAAAPSSAGPEASEALSSAAERGPADVATRQFRISEIVGRPATPAPPAASPTASAASASEGGSEPRGRTLADLYFAQGHYAEALRLYDELVAVNPFDEELRRLRRDAEARLLPAGSTPAAAAPDPAFERRLKRIRALKQWLSVLQAG